jgi:hypothetical protein
MQNFAIAIYSINVKKLCIKREFFVNFFFFPYETHAAFCGRKAGDFPKETYFTTKPA